MSRLLRFEVGMKEMQIEIRLMADYYAGSIAKVNEITEAALCVTSARASLVSTACLSRAGFSLSIT
jgi:hypothetical protein